MSKILGFDYEAEVPVPKVKGAKSAVNWVGSVKAFYNAYLKDNSKDSAEVTLEGIVKASTASVNLRKAIDEAKLNGKVAISISSHKEKKKATSDTTKHKKGDEIEVRIIDNVYLRITDEKKAKIKGGIDFL